ncbi:hypothetical protein NDU88_003737 [Pleurodeles waltl]|uniref:Uncharacterized protein n=1 Tax=Pleurodeles waltl TaxID=8319 RepID=A0AAV7SGT3_PLEWA|nr:hypothetical protein NDU88_003737 [Pleurodeles waltl]
MSPPRSVDPRHASAVTQGTRESLSATALPPLQLRPAGSRAQRSRLAPSAAVPKFAHGRSLIHTALSSSRRSGAAPTHRGSRARVVASTLSRVPLLPRRTSVPARPRPGGIAGPSPAQPRKSVPAAILFSGTGRSRLDNGGCFRQEFLAGASQGPRGHKDCQNDVSGSAKLVLAEFQAWRFGGQGGGVTCLNNGDEGKGSRTLTLRIQSDRQRGVKTSGFRREAKACQRAGTLQVVAAVIQVEFQYKFCDQEMHIMYS